jgi:signal transduction histidine kinase
MIAAVGHAARARQGGFPMRLRLPSSVRLSLSGVLAIGFAALIALTVAVGVVAVQSQIRSVRALNGLLEVDGRIAELSLRSNAALLKARRAERDFLLGQSEFGFEEARSRYVTFVRVGAAEIRQHMAEIRALARDPALVEQTRAIEQTVGHYETAFLAIVDLYGRLRGQDAGLETRLRRTAEEIEAPLTLPGRDRLMVGLLNVTRSAKEFMTRGLNKDARAVADGLARLKTDIAQTLSAPALKEPLLTLADEYGALFAQYVETVARINAEEAAYLNAARTVEPLLEKVYAATSRRALATQGDVHRTARTMTLTIVATGLVAVLLGLGVAAFVSMSLARWVGEGLGFAERIAAGDLATRLEPRGPTEFRTLARALNRMAEAMAESRRHLEESAAQLREFNQALQNEIVARQKTQEQLVRAQKMEAVGQLTGGLAHDFNNLLQVIIGNADVLADATKDNTQARHAADHVLRAATRGAELTKHLLAFGRRQVLTPREISLNALVHGLHPLLQRTLGEDVEIRLRLTPNLPGIMVDPTQMESALLNLALNARDAMPTGGALTIESATVDLDAAYCAANEDVRPGPYVVLSVSDTGTGMTPEVLAHAFEPFFTTKEVGKGSGLGLSMVHGFVKQSGGNAKIYSEVGHGTTVKLYFPQMQAPAAAALPELGESDLDLPTGTETILVVEDNPMVRGYVAAQLHSLGYTVLEAGDAPEALALLGAAKDYIRLVFSDVVMPKGMTGHQLAAEVRQRYPRIKVVLTSGYAPEAARAGGDVPGTIILSKPYRRGQLARLIRTVLDQAT